MDRRLQDILAQQQAAHFAGLAGTEARATIRVSDALLNEFVAAYLPATAAVRTAVVRSHERNRLELKVTLAKPAFLPPMTVELAIERQPDLPGDARLVLRLAGGAGGLMRLARPLLATLTSLPMGVRLDGDLVFVDLRLLLQQQGRSALLDHVQELCITSEEGGLAVLVAARIA